MALYSTGTVTVTNGSKTVQGSGTAWFGALQTGWMFIGPDGRTIGIADVVDNDTLKLTKPYLGSNASGQEYECFPTMSLAGDLATAFQGLSADFQGIIDGPGQGKFPNGTEASPGVRFEADPDTGLRRAGSNDVALVAGGSDKLRVSGNTASGDVVQSAALDETDGRLMKVGAFGLGAKDDSDTRLDQALVPLPAGFFGGSGGGAPVEHWPNSGARYRPFIVANRRSGSGVWYQSHIHFTGNTLAVIQSNDSGATWGDVNFLFGTDNLLGTVSEDGGVPTGAVIERGANSNGEYVRFADGTQIVTRSVALGVRSSTSTSGGLHRSNSLNFTMPAQFAASPVGSLTSEVFPNGLTYAVQATSLNWGVRAARNQAFTNMDLRSVNLMAVGRWF